MSNDETTGAVNRSALEGLVLEDLLIVLRNGPPDKAKHAFPHKSFPLSQIRQNEDFPLKAFLCLRQGKFPRGSHNVRGT
jgi:hypothetical protein